MNTGRKKSLLSYIPGYTNNAVLQLIVACGVAFVMLGITFGIILIVYSGDKNIFYQYFLGNLALPSLANFKTHWWTLFTYGWFQFNGFWELLSNMLWLYCFGSVVQMLVGHRQVIPLFFYSLLGGGIFFLVIQLFPGELGKIPLFNGPAPGLLGPRAGMVGLMAAAVTLTPDYRFYLTETFRVHILVVAGIFAALMILSSGYYFSTFSHLLGGAVVGFGYIKLLKAGYRPGEWIYTFSSRISSTVTPNEEVIRQRKAGRRNDRFGNTGSRKNRIPQQRIDDILDKINQKGYNSLTAEEREILMKAGKDE